jgi:hypothetical protein
MWPAASTLLLRVLVAVAALFSVVLMPKIDIIGEPHVFAGKAEQCETLPRIARFVDGTQAVQRFHSVGFSIQHYPRLRAETGRNKRTIGANSWRHNAKVWVVLRPREQAFRPGLRELPRLPNLRS